MDDVLDYDRMFWFVLGASVQSVIPFEDWEYYVEEITQQYYGMWIEDLQECQMPIGICVKCGKQRRDSFHTEPVTDGWCECKEDKKKAQRTE